MTDAKGATAPGFQIHNAREEALKVAEAAYTSLELGDGDHVVALHLLADAVLKIARILRESGDG
ncbi:MAG: hypothetical protein ACR2RF_03680 [Geminicoccaceae bacterium]